MVIFLCFSCFAPGKTSAQLDSMQLSQDSSLLSVYLKPVYDSSLIHNSLYQINITEHKVSKYKKPPNHIGRFLFLMLGLILLMLFVKFNADGMHRLSRSLFSLAYSQENFQIEQARNYVYLIALAFLGLVFTIYFFHYSIWHLYLGKVDINIQALTYFGLYCLFIILFQIFTDFFYFLLVGKIKTGEFVFYNAMQFSTLALFVVLPGLFFVMFNNQASIVVSLLLIAILVLLMVYLHIRLFSIAINNGVKLLNIHFILYICTLKILPYLVFIKIVKVNYGL